MEAFKRSNGWLGYFRLGKIWAKLRSLDAWIRNRLRYCIWKQWKKPNQRMSTTVTEDRLAKRGYRCFVMYYEHLFHGSRPLSTACPLRILGRPAVPFRKPAELPLLTLLDCSQYSISSPPIESNLSNLSFMAILLSIASSKVQDWSNPCVISYRSLLLASICCFVLIV